MAVDRHREAGLGGAHQGLVGPKPQRGAAEASVMSMMGHLIVVSAADARALRADPESIEALLVGPSGSVDDKLAELQALLAQVPEPLREAARKQTEAILAMATPKVGRSKRVEPRARLDLDKAWHGVHWLLCGSAEPDGSPAGDAILGGEEVGEDLGYGPARLLDPKLVQRIAAALAPLDRATLSARYDGPAMDRARLYPGGFARPAEWQEELVDKALALRALYVDAAAAGHTLVACLA